MAADLPARGGQALPVARSGIGTALCIVHAHKGYKVPASLKHCIIVYPKPNLRG